MKSHDIKINQEQIVKVLLAIFNNKLQYADKEATCLYIRNYIEYFTCDGVLFKFYKLYNLFSMKNKVYQSILCSSTVNELVNENKYSKNGFDNLYVEHLDPVNYVFGILDNLSIPISESKMIQVLNSCRIAAIDEREKIYLDKGKFTEEDIESVKDWLSNYTIPTDLGIQAINSMKDSNGKFYTCKEHGNHVARLIHMMNQAKKAGEELYFYFQGKKLETDSDWKEYFNNYPMSLWHHEIN